MAFAVGAVYNVVDAGLDHPVTVKAATTVRKGLLAGYNSGWVLADDSDGILAIGVYMQDGGPGDTVTITQRAIVEGVSGATAGNPVYCDEDGDYDDDVGAVTGQVVGRFLDANTMSINVASYAPADIPFASLAALDSAYLLVGSSANVATKRAITGDVTISNTGVTAIGANKVTAAMVKTAVKKNVARSHSINIDDGEGNFDYLLLMPSTAITVTKVRVVYEHATSGTIDTGALKVGTAAGGEQIVASVALESNKPVGYYKDLTIVSGAVAANAGVWFRFAGEATTVAGMFHLEIEYTFDD